MVCGESGPGICSNKTCNYNLTQATLTESFTHLSKTLTDFSASAPYTK